MKQKLLMIVLWAGLLLSAGWAGAAVVKVVLDGAVAYLVPPPVTSAIYYGFGDGFSGGAAKFSISAFADVGTAASPDINGYASAIGDAIHATGYFQTFDDPIQIAKFDLASFAYVSNLIVPGLSGFAFNYGLMIVDSPGTFLYVVGCQSPIGVTCKKTILKKIDLGSFTVADTLIVDDSTPSSVNGPVGFVINQAAGKLYVLASTHHGGIRGSVFEIDLGTFTTTDQLDFAAFVGVSNSSPGGEALAGDFVNGFLYAGTTGQKLHKISLSPLTDVTNVGGFSADVQSLAIDVTNGFLYDSDTDLINVFIRKINLAAFTIDGTLTLTDAECGVAGVQTMRGSGIVQAGKLYYGAIGTIGGEICRYDLATFTEDGHSSQTAGAGDQFLQ